MCVCREGVAGPLGPVWPPCRRELYPGSVLPTWGRGWSPGVSMAAVVAWPVPWAPCGHHECVAVPWAQCGRRGGVAGLLGPVWPPCGSDRSPGYQVAAVGAWPVPGDPCGGLGGVAGPLGTVWLLWGRGRFPGFCVAALGAWPVPGLPCGCRGGMVGPLGPVWAPWGRG